MSIFLDSNVLLYALGEESPKKNAAKRLVEALPAAWISTQVLNECSHVLRRKKGWPSSRIESELDAALKLLRLATVGLEEVRAAWKIGDRFGFSHYDSLIVATALSAQCTLLHSEDLQHGQVIEGRLTVLNPFISPTIP